MGKFRFLLLLLLSAFAIESGSSSPKSPEETYFAARDRFRLQFQASKGRNENEINRALRELETQLREMIGPVNIDGFSGPGAIALEAPGDGGANQVDGLLFSSDGVRLFVTTNTLLRANRWDEFARKSSEAHHVYRSSRGKDRKALADARRYEEEGFEAYRSCFGKNVKHGAAFPIVTRQAQSIVDRLQKAPSQEQQP